MPLLHPILRRGVWQVPSSSTVLQVLDESSSSFSLIGPNDRWGNWMALLGSAAVAQVLGEKTRVGQLLGPPVTAMALTFVMATIGIVPAGGTEASRTLQQLALQLATPLVLLGADLRRQTIVPRCGSLLLSFVYAAVATVTACVVGWWVVGSSLTQALPQGQGLILAAALMAKNIGGGLNYMAVCSTLQASPTAIAAGLCVDNVFALLYFPATSYLAAGRADPGIQPQQEEQQTRTTPLADSESNELPLALETESACTSNTTTTTTTTGSSVTPKDESTNGDISTSTIPEDTDMLEPNEALLAVTEKDDNEDDEKGMITVEQITATLFVAASLLYGGQRLGAGLFASSSNGGAAASLPLCTLLTVLVASNCRQAWMAHVRPAAQVMGTVALYVFFSTAGAPGLAVAESVRASVVPLGLFLTLLYSIHGGILWALYKLHSLVLANPTTDHENETEQPHSSSSSSLVAQSLEIPRLLCASSAAIGGPATAVALAEASQWESLKVPSLLVGNLGYAVATFLGLAYHALFSSS